MPGYRTNARQHDKNPLNPSAAAPKNESYTIHPPLSGLCHPSSAFPSPSGTLHRQVPDILDDETTERLDVMPISERTMPAYLTAICALQKTAAVFSSRSLYQMALSDLYNRLGKWS